MSTTTKKPDLDLGVLREHGQTWVTLEQASHWLIVQPAAIKSALGQGRLVEGVHWRSIDGQPWIRMHDIPGHKKTSSVIEEGSNG